ncbi:hypothetical protein Bbelb_112870 [Branchiostoma belcheri]|nr:hypothetical protein Bbelb_112870 [Branchiostoma belcheri]
MADVDLKTLKKEIQVRNQKFMALYKANDMKGLAKLYTEDCKVMAPGSDTEFGRDGVEKAFSGTWAGGVKVVESKTEEVGPMGSDVIYERGISTIKTEDGTVADEGKGRGRGHPVAPGGAVSSPVRQPTPPPNRDPSPQRTRPRYIPRAVSGQFEDAVPQPRNPRHGPLPKLPCRFDGTSHDVTWEEFETHLNTDRSYGEWDNDLCKTVLLRHLTGGALQTYNTAPPNIREGDCDLILDFMREMYSRPDNPSHYRADLFALTRYPGETPQALEVRIRRLVAKVHPQADQVTRDDIGLQAFLEKIDKRMAWELRRFDPKTLHEACLRLHAVDLAAVLAEHRRDIRQLQDAHERRVASLEARVESLLRPAQHPTGPPPARANHSPPTEPIQTPGNSSCNYCKQAVSGRETVPGWHDGSAASHQPPTPFDPAQPPTPFPLPSSPAPGGSFHFTPQIHGHSINVLIDSGADVSLITEDTLKKLVNPAPPPTLNPYVGPALSTVAGGALDILGCVCLPLTWHNHVFTASFVVCRNTTTPILVGTDFLLAHGAELSLRNREMTLWGPQGVVSIPVSRRAAGAVRRVVTRNSYLVPPRSVHLVPGKIVGKRAESTRGSGYVNPALASLGKYGLTGELISHTPARSTTRVFVVNETLEPVLIRPGAVIALFHPFDSPTSRGVSSLFDLSDIENPAHKERLLDLLVEYEDIVSRSSHDISTTPVITHSIETGDAAPIRLLPRRTSPQAKELIRQELDKLTSLGFIEPSNSPWGAPIVLVKKKNGDTRMCVDYRALNSVTKKCSWPLPRIDDTLDALSGSKLFSTLDMRSGYHQIPVDPASVEKTAFTSPFGTYQYTALPFGLCNAPSSFARLMESVLRGLQPQCCLAYLDDNIVHSDDDVTAHLNNLRAVFQRYREARLKLNPEKCRFLQRRVEFLGHVISGNGVSTDSSKTDAIDNWPTPRSVRDIQRFLGLANYYRRFVRGFAQLARPLTVLTRKGARFVWSSDCQTAFDALKKALVTAPVLAYPNFDLPFVVDTDASDTGIGGVLSQIQDGKERAILYYSRALTPAEQRYCTHRREMLAVVEFVTKHDCYLHGPHPFLLRTDNIAVRYLLRNKNPTGQSARWIIRLSPYDFNVEHRAGTSHGNADALSRHPCTQCGADDSALDMTDTPMGVNRPQINNVRSDTDLAAKQRDDPILGQLVTDRAQNVKPVAAGWQALTRDQRALYGDWDNLVFRDGVLYRQIIRPHNPDPRLQLLVPRALVPTVLRMAHSDPLGGHLGIDKTVERVKFSFYWPGLTNDVKAFVAGCLMCQRTKGGQRHPRAPLCPSVTGYPNERVAMDIVGPLTKTVGGHKYILVATDYFTKYVDIFPLENETAESVAEKFYDGWVCRHGPPASLHTDQGKNFDSNLIKHLCTYLKITKTRTTPYHPQSDGLVERFNRTMGNILRAYVAAHQRDWDIHLPAVRFAYNTSCHATTGFSPFFLMHGREARLPLHLLTGVPMSDTSIPQFVSKLNDSFPAIFLQVQQHTSQKQCRQKELYDKKIYGEPYAAGDLVLILNKAVGQGLARKLARKYNGPYRVLERVGDQAYKVQNTRGRREVKVIHFENLKQFLPQHLDPDYDPVRGDRPAPRRRRNNQTPPHSDTPVPADAASVHAESGPVTPQGHQSAETSSSSFAGPADSDLRATTVQSPAAPATPPVPAPRTSGAESPVTPPVPVPRTSGAETPATPPVPVPRTSGAETPATPPVPVLRTSGAESPVTPPVPVPRTSGAETPATPPVPVPRTSGAETPATPPVPVLRTSGAETPVTPPVPVLRTSGAETPVTPPVPVLPTTSTTVPTTSLRRRPSRRRRRPQCMNSFLSIPDFVPLSDTSDSETDHIYPNVCQVITDCSQDGGLTGQCPLSDRSGPRGESLEVDPSPPPLRSLADDSSPKS